MTRNAIRRSFYAGCLVIVLYTILFNATVPYLTGFESVREFWGW